MDRRSRMSLVACLLVRWPRGLLRLVAEEYFSSHHPLCVAFDRRCATGTMWRPPVWLPPPRVCGGCEVSWGPVRFPGPLTFALRNESARDEVWQSAAMTRLTVMPLVLARARWVL